MFAVYVEQPKPGGPLAALVLGERPEPSVPDEWVRVRLAAASLSMHDLLLLRGIAKVAAVFDTVGQAIWKHSMSALLPRGTLVASGMTSNNDPNADLMRLFLGQIRVIGSMMGALDELRDLMEFVAMAGISPLIGLELPLEQPDEGFRAMEEGRTSGKIVFTH